MADVFAFIFGVLGILFLIPMVGYWWVILFKAIERD